MTEERRQLLQDKAGYAKEAAENLRKMAQLYSNNEDERALWGRAEVMIVELIDELMDEACR
ncbi:MAG: hypothetical protein R3330_11740 [Saprospiraceae bacterium]|nr:hypothetical protein [Saprospiraceae bacterium]